MMSSFKSMPSLGFSYSSALTAVSTTTPMISVAHIKRVTIFAVIFHCSFFVCFMGNSLKMAGIHAKRLSAQVVEFKPVRNLTDSGLIRKFMSTNISSLTIYLTKIKQPITMPILSSFPQPAFIGRFLNYLHPKSFFGSIPFIHTLIIPRNRGECQWA